MSSARCSFASQMRHVGVGVIITGALTLASCAPPNRTQITDYHTKQIMKKLDQEIYIDNVLTRMSVENTIRSHLDQAISEGNHK